MPRIVPIEPIPNQEFIFTYENTRYAITLQELDDSVMIFGVSRNDAVVVSGVRVFPAAALIPFDYLDEGLGNFYFETMDEELPHYSKFGETQTLLFVTPEELESVRS